MAAESRGEDYRRDRHYLVPVLSAKTKKDGQECLPYSRTGELLLEAFRFIVRDKAIHEGREFSIHHVG
ncbi:MAG: hypothetical protein DMG70_01190 [Acidobacteria bacterium]|nr:MAG: hypothetical protein DMG70_01190 [Acidobacteriota bacterium]